MKSASLNHIYRLVWNEITNTYVAVAEHVTGRGKRGSAVVGGLFASVLLLGGSGTALAQILPSGASVAAGSAAISQSGSQMTINQATHRLVTNWNTFDVGSGASVRFVQPDASAIALNRVVGAGPASAINGDLSANGNVWLLNPNGVVFGKGAQVNVGGLVASSLGLSDSDFLAGKTRLSGGVGAGSVINNGVIRTPSGGVVALVAPKVVNTGSITTPGGSAVLAAGETVSLDFQGDGLVSVRVERGVAEAAVENSGRISAEGGAVTLSARGAENVLGSVVNNTGAIEARGLVSRDGRILLVGDIENQGSTHVSGVLDVTSSTGGGGSIAVTGKSVSLDGGAVLDASGLMGGGSVSVGGGWQGKDAAIANASHVSVDSSVTLRANAVARGDGGKVVAWSDDTTRFTGRIEVLGGTESGNGGKAEVSGKQKLFYDGVADARAAHGRTGDLLLDPAEITVEGGSGTSGDYSATGTGNVTVYEKTLEAQTANVLMQATDKITFNDLTGNGGDGVIEMKPNVSFRAEVINSAQAFPTSINFANKDNELIVSGTGSIYMQAGGGRTGTINDVFRLTAKDGSGAASNPAIASLPDHTVTTIGSGTPAPGSITLLGADGLTVAGALTTNGGYIRLSGDSDRGGVGNFNLTTPVTTNGGNLYVSFGTAANSSVATLSGDISLSTGRLYFGDAMGATKGLGASTGEKVLAGRLSLNGNVDFSTPLTMRGGASIYTDGAIRFVSTVKLDTGSSALTLRAADVDFSSATLTNLSTASLVLQPYDAATNIDLNGAATGIARASTFAKLAGIKNLTVGRSDGTGITSIPTTGFGFDASDTLKLLNGTVQIDGSLTNTSATGHLVAQAAQNITLASTGSVAAQGNGDGVVLAAGGNFTNNNPGASAVSAANGRWLIYSNSPANDVRGNLVNAFKQYNAHYQGAAPTDAVQGLGNGFLYSAAPVINVSLTGQIQKTYDGDTTATASSANLINSGTIDGDVATFKQGSQSLASYTTKAAETGKQVSVTDIELDTAQKGAVQVYGYQWNTVATGTVGVIDKRAVSVTNGSNGLSATVADKVYDGTTAASVTSVSLGNLAQGDAVNATGTGAFSSKDVGTGKSVTVSNIQLSGADAANYSLAPATTATASATIAAKALTATATVADKVYDGNTSAGLSNVALVGVIAGDQGSVSTNGSTGSFGDKNVGTVKAVNASGISLSGAGASNYTFDTTAQVGTAAITPKALTATASVADKTYDGTAAAALSNVALVGVVAGDQNVVATTGSTGTFVDRNAGAGKAVSGSGVALTGSGAGNYSFDSAAQIGTAAITPKALSATANVADKVYDGGTTATLSNLALVGLIAGDQNLVSAAGTVGSFGDKNVSAGKDVSGSGVTLTGSGAGNYTLDTAARVGMATITPKTVNATATVADKVYDGGTAASISNVTFSGVVAGDTLASGSGSVGTFDSKNVGTGKNVTGGGIVLAGADAGNYSVDASSTIGAAAITPKTITATANVADKVYDGNTAASLSNVAFNGVVAGDVVASGAGSSGTFDTKNVGTGKAVAAGNLVLAGADAGNYVVDALATVGTASITPKTLTATASVSDKVYDGTTSAALTGVALVGVVAGEQAAVGAAGVTGAFSDKNVGGNKAVAGSGITLTGTGAANYAFDTTSQVGTAAITPKTLSATASVADKVYNGTTAAAISNVALVGVVAGDQNAVSALGSSGSFADKNAGAGKVVSGSGITLAGSGSGNYAFDTAAQIGTAAITPKALTATATVADKVYDGTTSANLSNVSLSGIVNGDQGTVGASGVLGSFADRNVGSGKTVSASGVSLTGTGAVNYSLDAASQIGTASITPKTLSATASVADKVYDGTTSAVLSNVALVGVVAGDQNVVSATGNTGAFADKNAGTGKNVAGSGIGLSGSGSGNYIFDSTSQVGTAAITPKTIAATASVADKVYDGNTNASISGVAFSGVVSGDSVASTPGSVGAFDDKNAGTGKSVRGNGISLTGADAGNYAIDANAVIGSASITPRAVTATATIVDKVYDGGTVATLGSVSLSGQVAGDSVSSAASSTGTFDTKNVGTGKVVTAGGVVLSGADAGNYSVDASSVIGSGSITPKTLTATASVADKVYDGSTAASISGIAFSGVVANDAVTSGAGSIGTFNSKNAGTSKVVTGGSIVLAGSDAANYRVDASTAIGTASITPKTITATADVSNKVYDGFLDAAIANVAFNGVVSGDTVVAGTGSVGQFDTKNVGTGKTVTGGRIVLNGADAGNYAVDATSPVGAANVTPKTVIATANVSDKVYDGNRDASLTNVSFAGVVAGDSLSSGPGSVGTFDTKNAGTSKVVTGAGIALAGSDAANYAIDPSAAVGAATITPKTVVAAADVISRTYDGTTAAALQNVTFSGVIAGDALSSAPNSTGAFDTKNAGTGKLVTGAGLVLVGSDAGNYAVNANQVIGSGTVTPKTIQASANVAGKVYDGTRTASIDDVTFTGVVAGDSLVSGPGSTGTFDSKNAGTARSVSSDGIRLGGADAGNYVIDAQQSIGQATIAPRQVAATGLVADKVYDGGTAAQLSNLTLYGVVAGDAGRVNVDGTTGRYEDKNAGVGKEVRGTGLTLTGAEAANYVLNTSAVVGTGLIAPKVLTATAAEVSDKVYDGTTVANVRGLVLGGVVAGDEVAGRGGIGSFSSADVGIGKVVGVSALSLTGADAANYVLDRPSTTGSASIVALQNDASPATALIAPAVGLNGTAVLATRTLEPINAPVDATAQASLALLTTGRLTGNLATQPAAIGNTGPATLQTREPLVLVDSVLTLRGRLSLALEDGASAVQPLESSIPVYSNRSAQPQLQSEGQYAVTDRGSDISLILVGNATAVVDPKANVPGGSRSTEASVLQADGGAFLLKITLKADGTLTAQVPANGSDLSPEAVTAYALATAKKRFGVSVKTVKAVIVQYQMRTADSNAEPKVAGL